MVWERNLFEKQIVSRHSTIAWFVSACDIYLMAITYLMTLLVLSVNFYHKQFPQLVIMDYEIIFSGI